MNITATWDGSNWSYSPTQRPGGNRIVVDGDQTVTVTISATTDSGDTVALPASTSDYIQWPKGAPSWFTGIDSGRTTMSFSFLDPARSTR